MIAMRENSRRKGVSAKAHPRLTTLHGSIKIDANCRLCLNSLPKDILWNKFYRDIDSHKKCQFRVDQVESANTTGELEFAKQTQIFLRH